MTTLVRVQCICLLNQPILIEIAVATLNPATMEALQLFRGDTIIVRYVVFPPPKLLFSVFLIITNDNLFSLSLAGRKEKTPCSSV